MIYDVSLPIHDGMTVFEGDPSFERNWLLRLDKSEKVNLSQMKLGSHTGTHIDAPLHMCSDGASIENFLPKSLMGPCRVIEISDPRAVTLAELKTKSLVGAKKIVLKTRNSELWSKNKFSREFAYIEETAAQYLAGLEIDLLGFDYLSIERFGSDSFSAHLALMQRNVVIVEGLDLREVHAGDYAIFCGPLRIVGNEGSPARVFLADFDSIASWLTAGRG